MNGPEVSERDRVGGPDPALDADRLRGSTPPEDGASGANVIGRPAVDGAGAAGFHVDAESPERDAQALSQKEAMTAGGSFDGVAPLQDVDDDGRDA